MSFESGGENRRDAGGEPAMVGVPSRTSAPASRSRWLAASAIAQISSARGYDLVRGDHVEPSVIDPRYPLRVPNQGEVVRRDQAGESVPEAQPRGRRTTPPRPADAWRPEIERLDECHDE